MADELEIRVIVTRKASTEAAGEDVQLAEVITSMDSAERERFLQFMFATYGADPEGNRRDQQGMVKQLWLGIVAGFSNNVERWEADARRANADAQAVPLVTTTV